MTYLESRPFGLYVHWPFCVSKCPYCDFNSHVASHVDHDQWTMAFESELRRVHKESPRQTVSSIFFGGGTPSLMAPKTVERVIQTAESLWGFSENVEITLEANPTTVEAGTFSDLSAAGVNRLSIGVQSLRSEALTFLGRAHSAKDALFAVEKAAQTFNRFSFDLIYARPDQNLDDWQKELTEALTFSGGHLSVYQLTIEPGTPFYHDGVDAADEDLAADMYDLTQDILEKAGLPAYEISNHARIGEESRHNLIYWQGDNYVGVGPGAHSRHNNQAIHQIYKPDLWLKAVTEKGSGEQKRKALTADERVLEILLMGLRLRNGISKNHFKSLTDKNIMECLDPDGVQLLNDLALIEETSTHVKATAEGRRCLNTVLEKIVL